ncbi:DUF997 family protein [Sutterella sp.]|uniref:DUF997 family protein n=1 Tax=Sutterella sp. TaxID=1981025 RepID=UPI0026E0E8B0|nr:DUF997 family protein [Sutterella sp.]MDO5531323.1 DUF997 family protein [Sutterella sp.]
MTLRTQPANSGEPAPAPRERYDEALRICGREAAATLAAAVAVTVFFWGTLWLFTGSSVLLLGLPLWFVVAVIGGYLFSIVAVVVIVKRCFRPVDLERVARDEAARRAA